MKMNTNGTFFAYGSLTIAFCLCTGFAGSARAGTVTPPFFSLNCNGAVTYNEGSASCAGGSVSALSSPYTVATADFTGIGSYGSGDTGGAAQVSYFVVLNGGNTGDAVPVLIDTALSTSAGGPTANDVDEAGASISVNFANGNSFAQESVSCGNTLRGEDCSAPSWSGTLHATAWVGYDNMVTLMATSAIAGAGFTDAYADPHIYIDPTFAANNPQYSLEFNVSNDLAPTAPEPSTWLLGATALGALAWVRSRRNKAASMPV